MRIPVWIEGVPTYDDRMLLPQSVTIPLGPIPVHVVDLNNYMSTIVGAARDFKREDEGVVTAEVQLSPSHSITEDEIKNVAIELDSMTTHIVDGVLHVGAARLRAVTITQGWAWPKHRKFVPFEDVQ